MAGANKLSSNTFAAAVPMKAATINTASSTLTATVAGSKCAPCILGGGVWCSRTYAYSSSTSTLQG